MPIYAWNQERWPGTTVPPGKPPFRLYDAHGTEIDRPCCYIDTDSGMIREYAMNNDGTHVELRRGPHTELAVHEFYFAAPLKLIDAGGNEVDLPPEVYGTPRMKLVIDKLLDLRKILGWSGEMFRKGAAPPPEEEVKPDHVAGDSE